jgi:hypothetical protein
MDFSAIGNILKQYAGGNADTGNVEQHFDQVAQNVPQSTLAGGVADALRSNQTPPFAQIASQLFSNANQSQKASMLSALAASVGPAVLSKFASSNSGSSLASLLQSGQATVSPEQAANVSPQDVQALAQHAENHDPSVIDRLSAAYAQHPTLIKSIGAAGLAFAMSKISQRNS